MYYFIASFVTVAVAGALISESLYCIYKAYYHWLDDIAFRDFRISHCPILSSPSYGLDGADVMMAIIVRVFAFCVIPLLLGVLWPVTLLVAVLVALARHTKRIHKLRKEVENK